LHQAPNEPVEIVSFLETTSSAGLKIENYSLSSIVFPIVGAIDLHSNNSHIAIIDDQQNRVF
jgi:hypothetical protein